MPNVGPDGKLHATVEIRTKLYGDGNKRHVGTQLCIDGNDISADVLAIDLHLDGRGNRMATVVLTPALIDIEGASIQLTEDTVRGLNAMGWVRKEDVIALVYKAIADTKAKNAEEHGFTVGNGILAPAIVKAVESL